MPSPRDDWDRLKPDAVIAVTDLLRQLTGDESSDQDLLDAYLYAKPVLAQSMQALIRAEFTERCEVFYELRRQLAREMQRRYSGTIPDAYLTVPYGSRIHEELFSVLYRRLGESVPGPLLRVVTADSVHTERRIRELRELGADIESYEVDDTDFYTLRSLNIDYSKIPTIIRNTARSKGHRVIPENELIKRLG